MRVYISGPITGQENLNREAFAEAEALLTARGHAVFNPQSIPEPTHIDRAAPDAKRRIWQYFMRACVREIPDCSRLYMLRGWHESEGAREEHRIATLLGIPAEYQE